MPRSMDENDSEEPVINLTPLIDVVFVLLITFMLIAPILNTEHVDLAIAGPLSKKEVHDVPLRVSIKEDDSIWFQGKLITLAQLSVLITKEKAHYPSEIPQLLADKRCHFGLYQDVKNVFEECGFAQMDVVVK